MCAKEDDSGVFTMRAKLLLEEKIAKWQAKVDKKKERHRMVGERCKLLDQQDSFSYKIK